MRIAILNGPNLNLLGRREPEVYGSYTLESIEARLRAAVASDDVELEFFQSNSEGALIDELHRARCDGEADGVVINPGDIRTHRWRSAMRLSRSEFQ